MMDDRAYYIANCIERIHWALEGSFGVSGRRQAALKIGEVIAAGGSPAEIHDRLTREVQFAEAYRPVESVPNPPTQSDMISIKPSYGIEGDVVLTFCDAEG